MSNTITTAWRTKPLRLCAWLACAVLCACAAAGETPDPKSGGATIEWPASGDLSFSDGDTLEFTLRLPASLVENAPEDVSPAVGVWLAEPGKNVAADAPHSGRVIALRSSRPGEWIVQVRAIKPAANAPTLKLLTRWTFTKADGAKASGEVRYPGRISFGTKAIDIVLLMDGSWSMNESDPKRQRVRAVRDFVATARQSSLIGRIGIVQFDTKSTTLIGMTPVSGNFEAAINAISAVGMTDIEGGIRHALNIIEPQHRAGAAIVLFTDGNQSPGEYLNAHLEARKSGVTIHAMTLGRDADRKLLRRIAEETGGSYADAEKDNDISAAYAAIMSRIVRLRTIASVDLNANAAARIPVDPACLALQLATVAEKPGALKLQLPGGQNWSSGEASNPQHFAEKPAAGAWSAQWQYKDAAATEAVALTASARTPLYPLFFRATPLPAAPVELDANDPRLAVSLFNGDQALPAARVEARFDYVVRANDEKKTERATVSLFDDGKHGDASANDGIYGADIESLEFLAKNHEFVKGTLSVVVSGTVQEQPFQRELQSPFIVQRYAPPALVVTGALDFGEKFAGESVQSEIQLRVRGAGGALTTALENTPPPLAGQIRLVNPPAALKGKEKRTQALELKLPEILPPGEYAGVARFDMAGVDSVKLPWRVEVLPVDFKTTPARLDLGSVFPGATLKAKLKLATSGGTLSLASAAAPLLKNKPFEPFTLDKTGRDIDLEFALPENAPAADLAHELVFTDASGRERGRVPFSLRVLPVKLEIDAKLDFGAVESGDELKREIVLKWEGDARVPLTPRLAMDSQKTLAPAISALAETNGAWKSQFTLAIPRETDGEIGGSLSVEAGPFKQSLPWSARVIKPASNHAGKIDFGRTYPGKKIERTFAIDFTAARPINAEITAKVFIKPRIDGVALPENALIVTKKFTQKPTGESHELTLALTIPDDAQDGQYESALVIKSRLGTVEVPMTVKAVNVVDAAAFHVAPPRLVFRVTEGQPLPTETLKIVSHDDEPLTLALKIPALAPPPVLGIGEKAELPPELKPGEPRPAPLPFGVLFTDKAPQDGVTSATITVPPRGSVSISVRPRPDVREDELGALQLDGAGEHQEVELRAHRYDAATAPATVAPEPPKILNWLISIFVLLLIVALLLVRYFVKKAGVRYVCYALIVHLAVFSLAMPQEAIMSALPESIEVTLLDAQESLGLSLSDQQARRLDALHAGGGGADDKRAPVLAQAALPAKEGPVELPAPGAGLASIKPGPVNLEAARGVENPVRAAEVPEPARGAINAPILNDAPLALDVDKSAPVMKEKPAPAPKISTEAPRVAQTSAIQTTVDTTLPASSFTVAEATPQRAPIVPNTSNALPKNRAVIDNDRPIEAPQKVEPVEIARRPVQNAADAPLNIGNDAPLTFDSQPVAAPQVRPNPKAPPPDPSRNVPVSALESGLGSPGQGTLNAPLTPLELSAPGRPGTLGSGAGDTYVAMARTTTLPVADSSAGFGAGLGGTAIGGNAESDSCAGFGRIGGGLLAGGDEPLAIGADGGDGPGKKASGIGGGGGGGRGSGNGSSAIGSTRTGNGKDGSGGGGDNGFGGLGRSQAAGGGGLGGDGKGFATGGSGNGAADIGLPNGSGNEWHGRAGGKGGGVSLAPGLSSAQLEGSGNGKGGGFGGNGSGNGTGNGGLGNGAVGNGTGNGNGGAPGGDGFGPAGRAPNGFGMKGDGPGGLGDAPLAIGPAGGGGDKPTGKGIASGGGDPNGKGGGGGAGLGRLGAAGGTSLFGSGGPGGNGIGAIGGDGVGSGYGKSGSGGKAVSLARGPGSKDLDDEGGQLRANASGVIPGPPHRGITGPYTGGLIRFSLGLARHAGDWNSSPTALQHLRSEFIERSGLPEVEINIPTVDLTDLSAMLKCRVIMFTSNVSVSFKPAEIAAMREYIARGGTLWVNDSSASDYEKFDEGFRPQVPLLVPGAELERLEPDHDFFIACYDLSKGFKGFRIPPGDKYRQDFMEAAYISDPPGTPPPADPVDYKRHRRAGIVYTRNDYADGLEIDPRMNAGMKSLTDLTNGEMLESSLRFGMNLVAYSMGPQGLRLPPPPESVAEFEKLYRYKGPALPVLDNFSVLKDPWDKPLWVAEKDWCNETQLTILDSAAENGKIARVICKGGTKDKAAVTRFGSFDFSTTQALVFDLNSGLPQGVNVSLMFWTKDGKVYESRAVFVRPGWNRNLRFPLGMGDMKSSANNWQGYGTKFEPRNACERYAVLIYNLNDSGTVLIGPIREQK